MDSNKFKGIVLDQMKAVLKPLQFVKNGAVFKYTNSDISHYIYLQSSKYSTNQQLIFTINIGVGSELLYHLEGKTITSHLRGHLNWRIGKYIEPFTDKWWTIADENTAKKVGEEIKNIIKASVLEDLNSLKTTSDLVDFWITNLKKGEIDHQVTQYLVLLSKGTQ